MSKSDWKRGAGESRQQIELLRARWPKAFPAKGHEVRPLANAASAIAEALGWSNAYARGVLSPWVLREAYCRAVLAHAMRINLDGSESELTVDDDARATATKRLEQIAARKARAAAANSPPPAPLPEPEPAPPVAPEPAPEPPRARKILTLGASAKEALLKRGLGTTEVVTTIQRRAR